MSSVSRARRVAADIVIYGPLGEPQLVVEVKGLSGRSVDWATQWRRSLLENGGVRAFPYMLLAFPDHFYLWKQGADADGDASPDYVADATPILDAYTRYGGESSSPSDWGLEFTVLSWLQDIVDSVSQTDLANPASRWLADSGLYDAIRGGTVELPAQA